MPVATEWLKQQQHQQQKTHLARDVFAWNTFSGNIQGGGWKFPGHFIHHFRSRILSETSKLAHTKEINSTFSTKSEFYHINVSFSVRMLLSNIWSSFWVCTLPECMSTKQSIVCCWRHTHLQTESKSRLLQMLASLDSLDMTLFEWLRWFIAFKMSQEFSTASLDITPFRSR